MQADSLDIIDLIFANNNIIQFSLILFPPNPILQERTLLDDISTNQIAKALKIREELTLPFWESIALTFFSQKEYSTTLLKNILFHNKNIEPHLFSINEWKKQKEKVKESVNCALLSEVITIDHKIRHIPMLDFHCPNNSLNEKLAEDVINNIYKGKGYLLESGDSYHFFGEKLMTDKEMIKFLGKALQYSPIIDKMWIAHQLRELRCALRISKKHNAFPFLVRTTDSI